MNIPLFIKSLSKQEVSEFRNYFLLNPEIITTKDFLRKNEMSVRLRTILEDNCGDEDVFRYFKDINRTTFLRLNNAGERSWEEFTKINKK